MSAQTLSLPQIAALAHAPLIVVDTRAPAPADVVVQIGEDPYVVAFSSPELFDAWFSPEQPRVVVQGADMGRAVPLGAGFVVDPQQPRMLIVPPFDVPRVEAAGRPYPRGHHVQTGEQEDRPEELIAELAEAVAGVPGLRSARWVWHQVQGQAPYALVVIDAAPELVAQTSAACWPALARHRPPYAVELVLLEDDGGGLTWARENIAPFYDAEQS